MPTAGAWVEHGGSSLEGVRSCQEVVRRAGGGWAPPTKRRTSEPGIRGPLLLCVMYVHILGEQAHGFHRVLSEGCDPPQNIKNHCRGGPGGNLWRELMGKGSTH